MERICSLLLTLKFWEPMNKKQDYWQPKGESIIDKYPKLKYIDCFDRKKFEPAKQFTPSDWEAICKYVVYRADRESPASKYGDEEQCRRVAAGKAYLSDHIVEMIKNEEEDIIDKQ